jgi:uncharacterized protein YqgV (UPF0045/DUF77 family)
LVSLTRATFLSAELGFLGVVEGRFDEVFEMLNRASSFLLGKLVKKNIKHID